MRIALSAWLLLIVTAALAITTPARAADIDVTFCFDINTEFEDEGIGEDFWDDDSVDKPAMGFRYVIKDNNNGLAIVADDYLSDGDDGPASGCSDPVTLTVGGDYRVLIHADEGYADGNWFEHLGAAALLKDASYVPPSGSSTTKSYVVSGTTWPEFQQMVILARAVNSHPGGVLGETFTIDDDACCYHGGGVSHIGDSDNKFLIGHEIGHQAAWLHRGGGLHPTPNLTDPEYCDGGPDIRKAYVSQALIEGMGNFYAALLWNDRDDPDCANVHRSDRDYDLDTFSDVDALIGDECWGDPDTSGPDDFTDGVDWLSDLVNGSDTKGCTGALTNHSVRFDWTSYFVHLVWTDPTDGEGLLLADLFDIYELATTTDWDSTQSVTPLDPSDDPWPTWDAAANDLFPTEHANQDQRVNH